MSASQATIARLTRPVAVAALTVLAVVALAVTSTVSAAVNLLATTTVLAMTGTFTSTPYPAYEDMVANQYVGPALGPGYPYPTGVTTPEQAWPITGLFDHTFGTSVRIGVGDLEEALYPRLDRGESVLVFGYSQSSVISIIERRKIERAHAGNPNPPKLEFMCIGCLNLPNGGVMARYAGGYIPVINFFFNGAASAETPFPTTMVTNRWDGFADSPLYPLWLPSTINGVLGMVYAHTEYDEWTLQTTGEIPPGLKNEYTRVQHGNTTYYFLHNDELPLFGPARSLGVPEDVIDVFEPFFTELVELGYDRDIPPWQPTPARLVPRIDPFTAIPKLIGGIDEGIDNALELIAPPPPDVRIPAPRAPAAPDVELRSAPPAIASTTALPEAAAAEEEKPVVRIDEDPEAKPEKDRIGDEDAIAGGQLIEPAKPKSARVARPQARAGAAGELGSRVRGFLQRGHETLDRVLRPGRASAPPASAPDSAPGAGTSDPAGGADASDAAS